MRKINLQYPQNLLEIGFPGTKSLLFSPLIIDSWETDTPDRRPNEDLSETDMPGRRPTRPIGYRHDYGVQSEFKQLFKYTYFYILCAYLY